MSVLVTYQFRCSIVVSISACHAEDPGSIPGGGVYFGESATQRAINSLLLGRWLALCYGTSLPLTLVVRGWKTKKA